MTNDINSSRIGVHDYRYLITAESLVHCAVNKKKEGKKKKVSYVIYNEATHRFGGKRRFFVIGYHHLVRGKEIMGFR